ncbi:hypothetical protein EMCG_08393 [[Emmonsia] crescens]|uniref:Beta-lactamase-related domain-containing protein n=1 Tax=[Emmonsia] crescens TaxID=73230 RepID=A0A0G2I620_9EURO|nr:hypothetical protein EMCG_08393 [Emmonsia crescens UAMH 3008]
MPTMSKGTKPQFSFYHQGTLSGLYACVVLLPETESDVVVLVNTKPANDSADRIAQLLIETLLNSPVKNDYVTLTKESVQSATHPFPRAAESLRKGQVLGTTPRPFEAYRGRYYWTSHCYFVEIVIGEGSLKFVIIDRPDQIFEWLTTDAEEARRGRFIQATDAHKITLSVNEVTSFVWHEMGGGKT